MDVSIQTNDSQMTAALMGRPDPAVSERFEIADHFALTYRGAPRARSMSPFAAQLLEFSLDISGQVAIGVFCNWLWEKLKDRRVDELLIDGTEVDLSTVDTLTQAIRSKVKAPPDQG